MAARRTLIAAVAVGLTAAPAAAPAASVGPASAAERRAALRQAVAATPDGAAPPAVSADGDEPDWPLGPPSPVGGATIALVVEPVAALRHAGSGATVWKVPPETTWSRQPMTLLVLETVLRDGRRWLRVRLPIRPSGRSAWIPADAVLLGRTRFWVDVDTRRRTVVVRRLGRILRRFRAVVGAPRTPTPRGLTAVYERNPQPNPRAFLGPWAVALAATSHVLQEFDGGPGRIGIHGRGGASFRDPLGSARSHGCIRIDNAPIAWIARNVPAGAPVLIR
ncbi:L,D-transpeptidase [Patulibacter defluvii]|uniref:L,D-transpeptidase n=1 Tax=Patulibacter defluvii TaxID=3095358 RepID=UPI002A74A227|nr:L,D-transpeptidase [Patulibacter sp. DM4]